MTSVPDLVREAHPQGESLSEEEVTRLSRKTINLIYDERLSWPEAARKAVSE